jgi:hypothetical protein
MKNAVFWDETPCDSYKNGVLDERIVSIIRVKRISELGTTLALNSKLTLFLVRRFFHPDDIGDTFLRNVDS